MTPVLHFHSGVLEGEAGSVYLRPTQARLLVILARGHPADLYSDRLIESMWPDDEPELADNNIGVHVCRLRPKIRPFGLTIPYYTTHKRSLAGDLHIDWRRDPGIKPWRFNLPCRPYEEARS